MCVLFTLRCTIGQYAALCGDVDVDVDVEVVRAC